MDSSEETKEVTFRREGTTDLDLVLDDVSEATTVKMAIDGQLANQSAETSNPKLERNEENLFAMLQVLTDEVKSLKMRVDSKPEHHSELTEEDPDEDNWSVNSKIEEYIPVDQERWKSSKSADQAQNNLTSTLKGLAISENEDNWVKFEGYFEMLVESLELSQFIFDEQQEPILLSDLINRLADGKERNFDTKVLPGLYKDFLGRVYHRTFPGVEIISPNEKRRFDAAKVLLFSILTSCASSRRLEGVMNREGALESRNVSLMFRYLKNHFVQITGTSMTQKVLRLVSIARYDPQDKASIKAIEIIRESKRAFQEQAVYFPEIFFVSMFLGTLEPNSTIRDTLQLRVNEAGKNAELDSVVQFFHTWYRNQEIQKSNDSFTQNAFKPGKPPRDPKALLLSIEDEKVMKGCIRMGACYQCFKKNGDMTVLWKDCTKHNKGGKSGEKKGSKEKVKSKQVKVQTEDFSTLLLEATEATKDISEEEDYSSLFFHGMQQEATVKANSVIIVDSGAARTTLPTTSGLSNVHRVEHEINLEYANGEKGSSIVKEGTLLLNGKKLQALVSDDLVEGLLSTSQLDRELNAATVQSEGKSVSFIPNERQQQILSMLFNEMDKDDVIAEAELNEDGLYEVQVSKQSAKAYSVSVFPRVSTDSLSQAVYLLHASLSHMPKEAMIRLAESASEECRDTNSLHPMVLHWPPAITGKVIQHHWTSCKACLLAQQKRVEFFTSHSGKSKSIENKSSTLRVEKHTVPGELGQVDMWGPYPAGRSGCTHLFTLIDSYSQYAVSLPCVNRSGEIPKLLKQVLGIFLSLGVRFRMIVGDSAFNTDSCKHVFHHAYGESRGIQFSLAVPDEL